MKNLNIKMLVMDVDGTLTDGKIYIGNGGELFKSFSVKDGLRIKQLPEFDIIPVIITARESNIVTIRAQELGITELYQGVEDKAGKLIEIANKRNVSMQKIAYIGDDETDLSCMEICRLSACTADAAEIVKKKADYICTLNGGCGAVREFIDYILGLK